MPRKTSKQKEEYLAYYDEQKASGSTKFVAETAKKAKVTTRTVHNWIDERNESPKKDDTTDTLTEIASEKELDKAFNDEYLGLIKNPRHEKIIKFMKEKYPKRWEELLTKNFLKANQQTFDELERGIVNKDIDDLRKGDSFETVLNNKRKPLTYDDRIKSQKEQQKLAFAKIDNMWAGDQLELTQKAFETENNNLQTNENYRFFDEEMMSSLKVLLELQAILPSLSPTQQHYYKQKFMIEKGLTIFPLLERILYSNIGLQREPQLHDKEIHNWWASIPINERMVLLNKLNGQVI